MDGVQHPSRGQSTTVDKAVRMVQLLAEHPDGLGINALCRQLDTQKPGLLRILASLTAPGWVIKDPHSLRYRLGYRLLTLGAQALLGPHFQEIAHQGLRQLAQETHETANLGVLDQWQVVFIDQMEGAQAIRLQVRVGSRAPVHCTALGKAVSAHVPLDALNALWAMAPYPRFTSHTLCTDRELQHELERVRQQGFAVDNEEHREGICCIGAPIRNYHGDVVAAMSISGPTTRIPPAAVPDLGATVMHIADDVSHQLGYRAPSPEMAPSLPGDR